MSKQITYLIHLEIPFTMLMKSARMNHILIAKQGIPQKVIHR